MKFESCFGRVAASKSAPAAMGGRPPFERQVPTSGISKSIESQCRSKLFVAHAREIISGVNVSRPTKEELLERPEGE